jgi:hypothetical protein
VDELVRALDFAFDQSAPFVVEQLGDIIMRCLNYLGVPGFQGGAIQSILQLMSGLFATWYRSNAARVFPFLFASETR